MSRWCGSKLGRWIGGGKLCTGILRFRERRSCIATHRTQGQRVNGRADWCTNQGHELASVDDALGASFVIMRKPTALLISMKTFPGTLAKGADRPFVPIALRASLRISIPRPRACQRDGGANVLAVHVIAAKMCKPPANLAPNR